jgi:hypothetical protein
MTQKWEKKEALLSPFPPLFGSIRIHASKQKKKPLEKA